jgi:hypothetical protein
MVKVMDPVPSSSPQFLFFVGVHLDYTVEYALAFFYQSLKFPAG